MDRLAGMEAFVAVVDASRFEEGTVAKMHFEHHVPLGFHGVWVGAERAVPRAQVEGQHG